MTRGIPALILAALAGAALLAGSAPAGADFATTPIKGTVRKGSTTPMKRYMLYDPNGCRGIPPQAWTVSPKPQFGTVSEFIGSMKATEGPCPNATMPYLELRYVAGAQAGHDHFILHLSDGAEFTPIPVDIDVR